MRVTLIDGQGNFGSVDGDMPAAMRYTEMRLSPAAMLMLADIDKDTVDFQPNYDESEVEPKVLPAAFPNLLINGGSGIAVGMATNIPPHNPGEIIDATLAMIAEPDISLDALLAIVPGPDFPTAGIILGRAGIRSAYETGRGSITMRARAGIEQIRKDRDAIVVTEIPYQVNKSALLERMAELVRAKDVEGIADLRDESDRDGMRIVIELKRDATARGGAEPAVPLHQSADQFRHQHAGVGQGPAAADGAEGRAVLLHRVPRGSDPAARPLRAFQGAGPGASAGRPGRGGSEYRRGDPHHPRQPGFRRGAGGADGAGLAGRAT